ncbi:MAG: peptidoglycan editing factor PgeF [Myxococcota bacterium]|jgi:polyphenol oxidase|nr:peptidoglycan editing factor PgeF [Myxococcota bacterium]
MNEASLLESPLLGRAGFRHGFFTRNGGVSTGPYRSLSFSLAVGDEPGNVAENLRRAAGALGVPSERIYYLSQVHGRQTQLADGRETPARFLEREGDAVLAVPGTDGLACAVRSADCVPILVADRATGAVAAIHAGWRGVVAGAVGAAVSALREQTGQRGDLIAAIGPHISLRAFEVSDEVAAELARASDATDVVHHGATRPHVDLRRIVRAQLAAAGLESSAIDDVQGCTVSEPERFFSFRRDGAKSGRHLSAIVPRLP